MLYQLSYRPSEVVTRNTLPELGGRVAGTDEAWYSAVAALIAMVPAQAGVCCVPPHVICGCVIFG